MDQDILLQFGVAAMVGMFLMQVIDRLLKHFKRQHGSADSAPAGERSSEFWIAANYESARKAVRDEVSNVLDRLKDDTEKLRASAHRSNDISQAVGGKVDLANQKLDQILNHRS